MAQVGGAPNLRQNILNHLQAAQAPAFARTRPYVMRKNFNEFMNQNSLTYSMDTIILWTCICGLHNMDATLYTDSSPAGETYVARYLPPAAAPAAGAAPAAANQPNVATWNGQGNVPAGIFADQVDPDVFASCVSSINAAGRWMTDLTACHQVKSLNAGNIGNYFAGVPKIRIVGRQLVTLLDYTASRFPNMMSDQATRAALSDNVFMKYHTAYASTPKLCEEMVNASTAISHAIISQAQRDAIAHAVQNLHDQAACDALDTKTIACCHAYLAAFNKLPDNWYQGGKAMSTYPATLYSQMKQIWNRYKALSTGTDAINNAADEAALTAAIPAGIHA